MSLDSWKGKVRAEWSNDGEKGGTILQIAAHESWLLRTGEEVPLWRGSHPDSCPGMQPFLQEFLRTFGALIGDEARQRLLDFLPKALATHDFNEHGVNRRAEGKRCARAMNETLRLVQRKRPGPVIESIKPYQIPEVVNVRVEQLYELAKHNDRERVWWALYEVWWGGMYNEMHCAHNAAIVFAALDVEAGMRFLGTVVEPDG